MESSIAPTHYLFCLFCLFLFLLLIPSLPDLLHCQYHYYNDHRPDYEDWQGTKYYDNKSPHISSYGIKTVAKPFFDLTKETLFSGIGNPLYFVHVHVDGTVINLVIQQPKLTSVIFQFIPDIRKLALNGQQILNIFCLGK